MKYLVTGANGFIGSYLSRYLLKKGHDVIALSRSFLPEVKELLAGAEFIEADVLSTGFENLNVNAHVIVHLAASNDIVSRDLLKGIELSTKGTLNTIKLAIQNNIPKYIFFSTLQVYGSELSGEYDEETPVKPENDYAMNHLFGEMYAAMYSRKSNLKIMVVRPSNIYGGMLSNAINRWTLVPGCFCKEAVDQGTITLMSSGNQNRNFISLEQLSYATELLAQNMQKNYDVINFVSRDYKRIVDMAILTKTVFAEEFSRQIEIRINSNKPEITNQFHFNIEKMYQYGIYLDSINCPTAEDELKSVINMLLN